MAVGYGVDRDVWIRSGIESDKLGHITLLESITRRQTRVRLDRSHFKDMHIAHLVSI
jgi:hypothetical protein